VTPSKYSADERRVMEQARRPGALRDGQAVPGERRRPLASKGGRRKVTILWIVLIVVVVLALLGFFSRGRF
jgi:hypothetical protein